MTSEEVQIQQLLNVNIPAVQITYKERKGKNSESKNVFLSNLK